MARSNKLVVLCTTSLMLLLVSTEPSKLPSILLILPFLLIFVVLVLLIVGALRWKGLPNARSIRLALLGATLPMLALVLQSLGQLTVRDLITIIVLFAITYFYLSRITRPVSE
jgi:hypothetical protein